MVGQLVSWSVGRLVGGLVCLSIGGLVGWSVGQLVGLLVGGWSVGWLVGQWAGQFGGWLVQEGAFDKLDNDYGAAKFMHGMLERKDHAIVEGYDHGVGLFAKTV